LGKRNRAREKLSAPTSSYTDADGNVLVLRGSFTLGARREYAETLAGAGGRPAATREDAWRRAVELLFERLAVRWSIAPHGGAHPEGRGQAGAPIDRPRELLARLRVASPEERAWVRDTLREHCAEHFPDVRAP
jgi:hypothetical protein